MELFFNLFQNSYFALFVIIALGYMIGKIKVFGVSLDVSAVIFVALVFGHFGVTIDPIIQDIGLVLFIFTIGIQAGPGFFDSLKQHGVKLASLAMILILVAAIVTIVCQYLCHFEPAIAAGLLAGALTSTPGLASATDQFGSLSSIGYGIAYPFGVIGVIIFLRLLPKFMRANLGKEEQLWEAETNSNIPLLVAQNFRITNENVNGKTLGELQFRRMTDAVVSRVMHGVEAITPSPTTILYQGDLVRAVGTEESIEKVKLLIGQPIDQEIPLSGNYDVQSVLVTNKEVVSKTLAQLNLQSNYDATVTRIRRSGIDIKPSPDAKIRFGDKLVVACSKDNMEQVFRLFGNDAKRLSDTDIFPIALGIVLGVLVGKFTFLGLTGGVLVVALVLSRLGKTGPILWTMSSASNLLLRELGLIFFLSVVGTQAGATLVDTYLQYGYELFLAGAIITLVPMIATALIAKLVYKTNLLTLLGALAGGMTSTPGLAAISPMTKSNAPQIAYATVYPIAMVLLVLVVKLLALFS